jgi:hypothetical protein
VRVEYTVLRYTAAARKIDVQVFYRLVSCKLLQLNKAITVLIVQGIEWCKLCLQFRNRFVSHSSRTRWRRKDSVMTVELSLSLLDPSKMAQHRLKRM